MLDINFDIFPELTTDRLILRRISNKDAGAIFTLRSDKRVMHYLDRPPAVSIDDASQWIQKVNDLLLSNDGITWAITLKEDLNLIGTVGLWRIIKEHHRAEIGYLLQPELQGKGIMQEALTAVIHYGFNALKLHSIEANVNPENAASVKLLERNNFIREAYFKENYYFDGQFLDSAIYSLLTPKGE